jgi:hypothetical protein
MRIKVNLDWTAGGSADYRSVTTALDAITDIYPDAVAYDESGCLVESDRDWQPVCGWDQARLLVRESEADSRDDDGSRAIAEIRYAEGGAR